MRLGFEKMRLGFGFFEFNLYTDLMLHMERPKNEVRVWVFLSLIYIQT